MPALNVSELHNRFVDILTRLLPQSLLLLVARVSIAAIFFQSGRTKVEGWLTITPGTYDLFSSEYALPFIASHIAAQAATYSEHIFPILLVLGLFTRPAAIALLGMTGVIQIFVYPDAWPTHLGWTAILLPLVGRGGGAWSLDHHIKKCPAVSPPGTRAGMKTDPKGKSKVSEAKGSVSASAMIDVSPNPPER